MSKSGLYAHFGSKEELQLATIEAAQEIFEREVDEPTRRHPAGIEQLLAFCDAYLSYLERARLPGRMLLRRGGGGAEHARGSREGQAARLVAAGMDALAETIREAQSRGEVDAGADADQLAFEIDALLHAANGGFVMFGGDEPLERARRGVRLRLGRP